MGAFIKMSLELACVCQSFPTGECIMLTIVLYRPPIYPTPSQRVASNYMLGIWAHVSVFFSAV